MRWVLVYSITLLVGIGMAYGLAWLIALILPWAKWPVFIIGCLCWSYWGWQHAKRMDQVSQ